MTPRTDARLCWATLLAFALAFAVANCDAPTDTDAEVATQSSLKDAITTANAQARQARADRAIATTNTTEQDNP